MPVRTLVLQVTMISVDTVGGETSQVSGLPYASLALPVSCRALHGVLDLRGFHSLDLEKDLKKERAAIPRSWG